MALSSCTSACSVICDRAARDVLLLDPTVFVSKLRAAGQRQNQQEGCKGPRDEIGTPSPHPAAAAAAAAAPLCGVCAYVGYTLSRR